MEDNQLESMVRESIHAMRAYISPIKTFLELERQGLVMSERDALVIQAGKMILPRFERHIVRAVGR